VSVTTASRVAWSRMRTSRHVWSWSSFCSISGENRE
jgi:hypothetical protein